MRLSTQPGKECVRASTLSLFALFVAVPAALPLTPIAQQTAIDSPAIASAAAIAGVPPDAPEPQFATITADATVRQVESGQTQNPQPQTPGPTPAQSGSAQPNSNSGTQPPAQQQTDNRTQQQKAEEQLKEQEHQRVLGIVPAFNTSYRSNAVSLTAGQKIELAFRSSVDPATFGIAFVVSGLHEALDDDTGFRWGVEGYGRRTGAAYLDAFDGTMIGNGFLPALLHQDPRYFRLGHGSAMHRLLYAAATSVICKHDNSGKWQPNYSNVAGNIISGAISNFYYPPSNTGIGLTISNGFIVTGEGTAGGVFQEFWPDLSRKVFHKDPTHGLDAQARAQDKADKQARKEAREKQKEQQGSQ